MIITINIILFSHVVPGRYLKEINWYLHIIMEPARWTFFYNNVPVDANFLDQLDTAGTGIPIQLGTAASRYNGPCNRYQPTSSHDNPEWHRQTVLNVSAPVYEPTIPHYEIGDNRLASFQEWPKCMKQTPEQMADAGFFYTGKSDVVICFCCGGQLRDWLPEHNPWVEHAKNFSGCPYLKLVKTPGFIAECQAKWYTNDVLIGRPEYPGHDVTKRKEQHEVSDENCCKICYTRPFDTVFIPCGHVVACGRCAASTLNCPVCNKWYTSVQRIFFT